MCLLIISICTASCGQNSSAPTEMTENTETRQKQTEEITETPTEEETQTPIDEELASTEGDTISTADRREGRSNSAGPRSGDVPLPAW